MNKCTFGMIAVFALVLIGLTPSKAEAAPLVPALQQQSIVQDVVCIGCRRVYRRGVVRGPVVRGPVVRRPVVAGPVVRRPVRRTVRRAARPWRW